MTAEKLPAVMLLKRKEEAQRYLRFLMSFAPSRSHTKSKPSSMSFLACATKQKTYARDAVPRTQKHKDYPEMPQLIAFADDEYACKIADNIDQAKQLTESSFDYVTDIDEHKLFRKRK